jgi:uncharacterized protein (DUF427 family)/ABC-type Mn2+/Zn2+ transport system ATPase subunit
MERQREPLQSGQESVWDYPRPPHLDLSHKHVQVVFAGTVVADSRRAVRVLETSHPPVFYLPPEDVRTDLLTLAPRSSVCEFKGQAAYWTLSLNAREAVDAAWSYPRPAAGFEVIRDYLAFYPSRVEACFVDGERVKAQAGDFYGGWITDEIKGPSRAARERGAGKGSMSELLRLTGVHFRGGAQEILRGTSFALSSGEKVGLVGANGAGKTTLLSLTAGLQGQVPTDGQILRAPGLRLGYVEQSTSGWRGTLWAVAAGGLAYVRELEAALRETEARLDDDARLDHYGELTALFEGAGGYEAEVTLQSYLSRLGFAETDYAREVTTLSGGERARLGLARALAERPDLLLLDEPSSYLDLPTKRWLAETLARSPRRAAPGVT